MKLAPDTIEDLNVRSAPKHHGWPDVPSQRKRRILARRARAFAGRKAR